MAKADLQRAQDEYDEVMRQAADAERAGDIGTVLRLSQRAWDHVLGMMQFESKYEQRTIRSVQCVDYVLKYAPLYLDAELLDRLGALLKQQKGIDRIATDDLAGELAGARARLSDAYRLWDLIERTPSIRQDGLRDALGGFQDQWREIVDEWERWGLVVRTPADDAKARFVLELASSEGVRFVARCLACGRAVAGELHLFLERHPCPACNRNAEYCVLRRTADVAEVSGAVVTRDGGE